MKLPESLAVVVVVTSRPISVIVTLALGTAEELKSKGDAAAALALLETVPSSAEAEDEIGFLLAVLGRRDDAIPHFEKALSLKSNYAPALYHLGVALWLRSPDDRALGYLAKGAAASPAEFEYRSRYAQALEELGRHDEAVPEFRAAAALRPQDADT